MADDELDELGELRAGPRTVRAAGRLDATERRRVALAAILPVPTVALALLPFALLGYATFSSVLGAAMVYGALLSLAASFVTVDRLQNRQCPGCGERNARRDVTCGGCAYDLVARPIFACQERHRRHVEQGLCVCGRRLQTVTAARGIGPEIAIILRAGAWMLAFLLAMGLLFKFTGS